MFTKSIRKQRKKRLIYVLTNKKRLSRILTLKTEYLLPRKRIVLWAWKTTKQTSKIDQPADSSTPVSLKLAKSAKEFSQTLSVQLKNNQDWYNGRIRMKFWTGSRISKTRNPSALFNLTSWTFIPQFRKTCWKMLLNGQEAS